MKAVKQILIGALSAVMLAACSDDKLAEGPDNPGGVIDEGDGVYFSLLIDLPNAGGSRSETTDPGDNGTTSSGGVEIGKDYENGVTEAILILADAHRNEFIAASTINAGDLNATGTNKSQFIANSKFSKTTLSLYYEMLDDSGYKKPEENLVANIFIFCNPTGNLRDYIFGRSGNGDVQPVTAIQQGDTVWYNVAAKLSVNQSIWTNNSFLMSNALIAQRELPANITQWNVFTEKESPFKLSQNNTLADGTEINNGGSSRGSIKVERTCARFDFRDGSNDKKVGDNPAAYGVGGFTYNVLNHIDADTEVESTEPFIRVTLDKMYLVNISKSFYYLPHTSPAVEDGGAAIQTPTSEILLKGLCKPEERWIFDGNGGYDKPYGNYMLDQDWSWKNEVFSTWTSASEEEEDGNSTEIGQGTALASPFDQYFDSPFFNNDGTIDNTDILTNRWTQYLCSDVVKGESDNQDGWTGGPTTKNQYKIWRYATENVIPSIQAQINGISTGVVFKSKIFAVAPENTKVSQNVLDLVDAFNNKNEGTNLDPIIYKFDKTLFCSWENLREAAIKAANPQFTFVKTGEEEVDGELVVKGYWELRSINRTIGLYKAVFGRGGVGEFPFTYTDDADHKTYDITIKDDLDLDENSANVAWEKWVTAGRPDNDATGTPGEVRMAFKEAVTDAGITIYQRSYDPDYGWGYYCYYYYWNRHNDNGFNGIMGPMEFAVVRNNVYKLAVTLIKDLGHPRISENDPHKPGPGTRDEDESVYIEVTSEILPWVVRVNDIEF